MPALFLSIRPKFVDRIMTGQKTVELRRIRPNITAGDTVMVYASSPRKELVATFSVRRVDVGSPKEIWKRVGSHSGVSAREFSLYFSGSDVAVAIAIKGLIGLTSPIALSIIRQRLGKFQPPQSFRYLSDSEIGRIFGRQRISAKRRSPSGKLAIKTSLARFA